MINMIMYTLNECNFVITNVCNFDCPECNRFNNYNFSGHYFWKNNKEKYEKWSKIVDIGQFTVLGGEPMANKDYKNWLVGLRAIWPNSKGKMITNGSLLKNNDSELYDILKNHKIELEIGLHNSDRWEEILLFVSKFLKGKIYRYSKTAYNQNFIATYNNIKAASWPELFECTDWDKLPIDIKTECDKLFDFTLEKFYLQQLTELFFLDKQQVNVSCEDENGVAITIYLQDKFFKSALIPNFETRTFTLHNSDRETAHAGCETARGECRQFVEGKLYKCSISENLATVDKQFVVDMPDDYRKTINGYVPGDLSMSTTDLDLFMNNLNKSIPHCSSCTENYDRFEFKATRRKTVFIKKLMPHA